MNTPVAYIIFNRPDHTRQTFAAIREQRPATLFIVADGPRRGHPADAGLCGAARTIVENIDWPCNVRNDFSEQNLGCKLRLKTGIDWVFSHVDRAIILEDDCLPHPDFFVFCEELLERYADDDRVSLVTGNNFQGRLRRGAAAYYFSKYGHTWGWATWRRSWLKNDSETSFWPDFKHSPAWKTLMKDPAERRHWESVLNQTYAGGYESTWDYQWQASVWHSGGLTATPNVNLVTNIGCGPGATHTVDPDDVNGGLPTAPLGRLTHPERIEANQAADRYAFDHGFGGLQHRLGWKLWRLPRRLVRRAWHGRGHGQPRSQ